MIEQYTSALPSVRISVVSVEEARPMVATHSGPFHADDVFAVATLALLHEGQGSLKVVRSRNHQHLEEARYRVDVGGQYSPSEGDFDHHQWRWADPGAPTNCRRGMAGVPYAAFGLVWREYGEEIVKRRAAALRFSVDPKGVAAKVDKDLVQYIDAGDTGYGEGRHFASDTVAAMNPPWNTLRDRFEGEVKPRFEAACAWAAHTLMAAVDAAISEQCAVDVVSRCVIMGSEPGIVELPSGGIPWQDTVCRANRDWALVTPVDFVVYPTPDGTWMVQCVPPEPDSFGQRRPLPLAWAGLRGADLAAAAGVEDAVFCHAGRFIAGAGSLKGALALAELAMRG
jgi:uncharacterized UPF0160 family protein